MPAITDPDGDKYSTEADLRDSLTFTKIVNNTFAFLPSISDTRSNPYIIKIILTDNHPNKAMGKRYYLKVIISLKTNASSSILASKDFYDSLGYKPHSKLALKVFSLSREGLLKIKVNPIKYIGVLSKINNETLKIDLV